MHKNKLVYIMGAGRSGTTALATFLGNNQEIQNIGEMHHFFKYLDENKKCYAMKNYMRVNFGRTNKLFKQRFLC